MQHGSWLLKEDRELLLSFIREHFSDAKQPCRIFITGATGLFGKWLTETLMLGVDALAIPIELTLLVRDVKKWESIFPSQVGHPKIKLITGDIRDFRFPDEKFTDIVHLATPASAKLNSEDPIEMWQIIVKGMERVLEFARHTQAERVLFTSSGAIYGDQPNEISHVSESYRVLADHLAPQSAYAEGKRAAEHLCAQYYAQHGLNIKIARCFAFLGPQLPLDRHFAAGNFLADGLAGRSIKVAGDGTPFRSYLYLAELVGWLMGIWFNGKALHPYNVGSEHEISIRTLAESIGKITKVPVEIAGIPNPKIAPKRYVPSTHLAQVELGLKETINLEESIERTFRWYEMNKKERKSECLSNA